MTRLEYDVALVDGVEFVYSEERRLVEETASLLEQQLVHSVYEEIAGHFSDTRHKPWPRVAAFIQVLQRVESWKVG